MSAGRPEKSISETGSTCGLQRAEDRDIQLAAVDILLDESRLLEFRMDRAHAFAEFRGIVDDRAVGDPDAAVLMRGLHDQREGHPLFQHDAVLGAEDLIVGRADAVIRQNLFHAGLVQCRAECKRTGAGVRDLQQIIESGDVHLLQRFVLDALHEIEDHIRAFRRGDSR